MQARVASNSETFVRGRLADFQTFASGSSVGDNEVKRMQRGVDWQMKCVDVRTELKSVEPRLSGEHYTLSCGAKYVWG